MEQIKKNITYKVFKNAFAGVSKVLQTSMRMIDRGKAKICGRRF